MIAIPKGLGVAVPWQQEYNEKGWNEIALAKLGNPPYYDWTFDHISDPSFVPMLSNLRYGENLDAASRADVDRLWFLGAEPHEKEQGNSSPKEAVQAVTLWLNTTDATEWAGFGCSTQEKGKFWLLEYIDESGPLPPIWHWHITHCRTDNDWKRELLELLEFLDKEGILRPIIISEACGWSYAPSDQLKLMTMAQKCINEIDNLLAVFWYSVKWQPWEFSSLLDASDELTILGQHFLRLRKDNEPSDIAL